MKERKTSRVLNDQSYVLGLSYSDITGAGLVLLGFMILGKILGIESMMWALVLTLSSLTVLIPVRLRFRRKILRDAIYYLFNNGVCRVSKNSRIR